MICLQDCEIGLSGQQFVVGADILLTAFFGLVQPVLGLSDLRFQSGQPGFRLS